MKIGIIVHSQSGHTLDFAKEIESKLRAGGHDPEIRALRTVGEVHPRSKKFQLRNPPSTDEFDAVLFGGPVWAFGASPVVMAYLSQLGKLKGKKALCFVTMGFPFPWLGGKQAIKAMNTEIEMSGAEVLDGEIIQYAFKRNSEKMAQAAERIAARLGS